MSEVQEQQGPKIAKRAVGIREDATLKVLVTENPKREESQAWERFQNYFTLDEGATVKQAIEAGLTMGDIKYDVIHGFIEVDGASVEEYEVTPRGARQSDDGDDGEEVDDSEEATETEDSGF